MCIRDRFALLPVEGTLYCVGAATVDALKALWKVACAVIERLMIDEYSLANRCSLVDVTIERSVVAAVVELNSVPVRPPIWVEPPPPTLYWNVVWPAENTALPDTE